MIQPRPPAGAPDLAVGSPAVSDGAPAIGEQFTLSVIVRNDGDAASAATTLRYYRSTDATLSTSDTEVGTEAVAALAASGNGSAAVELTAPSNAGTYYYGACVDAVTDESDTTNNCSASVQVDVAERQPESTSRQNLAERQPESTSRQNLAETQPQLTSRQNLVETQSESTGHPDLVVAAPTVSDGGPAAGARFTLSTTVRNDGDAASAATTLRYYRSTDATITMSDRAVGTDAVAVLAASGSASESVELTAPSSAGTYYYGACVDAVTDESDTTNNCSASVAVTVSGGGEPATEVHLFRSDRVKEGDASSVVVVAWTSGDRPPAVSITVRVSLVEGTATEGVDFAPFSQSVVFRPSDFTFRNSRYETHTITLPITILDDTEAEGDETFGGTMMLEGNLPFVTLSPTAPAWLSITIVDND